LGRHEGRLSGSLLDGNQQAYLYARRNAENPRFSCSTGKIGDLAGFASAVILEIVAILIGWESFLRLAALALSAVPS